MLTTEAPGLVEGFITVVLEEEMAMRNIIKARNLEAQVSNLMSRVQKNLSKLAERVVEEFSYEPIVSQHVSNGLSREQAVLRVMSDNIPLQEQVAVLALLVQMFNFEGNEELVAMGCLNLDEETIRKAEAYWSERVEADLELVQEEARKRVFEANKNEPDFVGLVKSGDLFG